MVSTLFTVLILLFLDIFEHGLTLGADNQLIQELKSQFKSLDIFFMLVFVKGNQKRDKVFFEKAANVTC